MVGDDSRYDPMDDKKPRAGQILWIRGLTRLQTQVSVEHNLKVLSDEL
jgi:Ca2+ transporting ATPase